MASFEPVENEYEDDDKQENDNDTLINITNIACCDNGGYKLSLFVNKSKSIRYKCGLCSNICHNAVELRCIECSEDDNDEDIVYCQLCLNEYLNENNYTCPLNKNHKNVTYEVCQYIRDKINNSKIYCPTNNNNNHDNDIQDDSEGSKVVITQSIHNDANQNQCEWTGKLDKLSYHLQNECKFYSKPTKCKYSKYGCSFHGISQSLTQHNDESMQNHLDLLSTTIDKNMEETASLKADNAKLWEIINYLQTENTKLWNAIKSSHAQSNDPYAASISPYQPPQRQSLYESPPPIGLDSVSQNSLSGGGINGGISPQNSDDHAQEINMEMLNALTTDDSKILLSERLYAKIELFEPVLAARITSMILEMDNEDILELLVDKKALMNEINEALEILKAEQLSSPEPEPISKQNRVQFAEPVHVHRQRVVRIMDDDEKLSMEMLQDLKPMQAKRLIGERLLAKIQVIEPRLAERITVMLLELDNAELLDILDDQQLLTEKCERCMMQLNTANVNKNGNEDMDEFEELEPLSMEMLNETDPKYRKSLIGERLYPKIEEIAPDLAGRITSIMLEMDNMELMELLKDDDGLIKKVKDVMEECKLDTESMNNDDNVSVLEEEPLDMEKVEKMKFAEVKVLVKDRLLSIMQFQDIDHRVIGKIVSMMLHQRDKEELINLLLFDKKILINQMNECVATLIDKQQNGHH